MPRCRSGLVAMGEMTENTKLLCLRCSCFHASLSHVMSYSFFIFEIPTRLFFFRVGSILNPGSGGWWQQTFPRETKWTQSGVLKQIQTNTAGFFLGDTVVSVCIRHQIVHWICLPNPRAKTSPVILHESQSHSQRKLNLSAKALMCWQMRPPCSLQAAQALDVLLRNNSWKAFCGLENALIETATVISVTFGSQTQQKPIFYVTWSRAEQ